MKRDLTTGSPAKQILLFTIPFLIGNLFQQFYNIADMVIVGRTIDSLAYAAVGSTGSLVWFASGAIQSLTVGFSAVTARFVGAGDEERVKRSFAVAIKLSAVISVLMAIACVLLARPMLTLLRTPENLFEPAYQYVVWIFAGLVATALFNLLSNTIRALGDSRTPLYFLIVACVVNIILDIVFITAFRMGTAGAGLATVIAQLISGLLCILYMRKKHPALHLRRRHFSHDGIMNKDLLRIGIPMALLNMVLSIGSVIVQFVTNGFGDLYVSAQVTGSKIETFLTQPLLSFGSAVSVFAAQNHGAKKHQRILDGSKKTMLMCCAWCVIAALILLPFGKFFIRLIAGASVDPIVVDYAYTYILINTAMTFVLSALIVFKSVLQAVGRTTWSMVSGFTEIAGRGGVALLVVALTSAAVVDQSIGFTIVCFSNPAAWLFGLLTVIADYCLMRAAFKRLAAEEAKENAEDAATA